MIDDRTREWLESPELASDIKLFVDAWMEAMNGHSQ